MGLQQSFFDLCVCVCFRVRHSILATKEFSGTSNHLILAAVIFSTISWFKCWLFYAIVLVTQYYSILNSLYRFLYMLLFHTVVPTTYSILG